MALNSPSPLGPTIAPCGLCFQLNRDLGLSHTWSFSCTCSIRKGPLLHLTLCLPHGFLKVFSRTRCYFCHKTFPTASRERGQLLHLNSFSEFWLLNSFGLMIWIILVLGKELRLCHQIDLGLNSESPSNQCIMSLRLNFLMCKLGIKSPSYLWGPKESGRPRAPECSAHYLLPGVRTGTYTPYLWRAGAASSSCGVARSRTVLYVQMLSKYMWKWAFGLLPAKWSQFA